MLYAQNYGKELQDRAAKTMKNLIVKLFYLGYWHVSITSTILGCESLGVNTT